jgi:hypothetical protein
MTKVHILNWFLYLHLVVAPNVYFPILSTLDVRSKAISTHSPHISPPIYTFYYILLHPLKRTSPMYTTSSTISSIYLSHTL